MDSTIDLYRCLLCRKLRRWSDIEKSQDGRCSCGSNKISGGAPLNLLEKIKVWFWWLEVTWNLNWGKK